MGILESSPQQFAQQLQELGIHRAWIKGDRAGSPPQFSHPILEPLESWLSRPESGFEGHEGVFLQTLEGTQALLCAFVHRTHRGQAQGGTRFWSYDHMSDFLFDGNRLSKGMTHKNSLAGLWWGGGKGVISHDPAFDLKDPKYRSKIFRGYGEFVTSLQGVYVTAKDVGVEPNDMAYIFETTRFVTCIPSTVGGSGNPSFYTAKGTVSGIKASLEALQLGPIEGKTFVVQGAGHVGTEIISMLIAQGAGKIHVSDISQTSLDKLKSLDRTDRLQLTLSPRGDVSILEIKCDVLVPCATGAILNQQTIPLLQCKIVCGAANNQLADPKSDDQLLHGRGIFYVPDFLVNRMGIVHCANEQFGYVTDDPAIEKHFDMDWEHSVPATIFEVRKRSVQEGHPPGQVALAMAEELSIVEHPIFGHRGQKIIESLVKKGWA